MQAIIPKWFKIHEGDIEIVMIIIGPIVIGLRIDKIRLWWLNR
jgi:hypothetical protein